MATVGVIGPFRRTDSLEPGESRWVNFGWHQGFDNCALSVSASVHAISGGDVGVLKVDDVNITADANVDPDHYSAGCNVTNTGSSRVTVWSVLVGVIKP